MSLICPLCQAKLQRDPQRWHCSNRHSFDIAKQGYCNLLPVQNKRSKLPGDDKNMVLARKAFLNAGHYQPLSDALCQLLTNSITTKETLHIIDAGCGEGYYTRQLAQHLNRLGLKHHSTGIDISKFAVLEAAKADKNIDWLVANSKQLPVADHSQHILLSLFAPLTTEEFARCLKHEGLLLVASTGATHLIELRQQLYDTVNNDTLNTEAKLASHFSLVDSKEVQFQFTLNEATEKQQLLMMTPHYWKSSPERQQRFTNQQALKLSADISLQIFKKHR